MSSVSPQEGPSLGAEWLKLSIGFITSSSHPFSSECSLFRIVLIFWCDFCWWWWWWFWGIFWNMNKPGQEEKTLVFRIQWVSLVAHCLQSQGYPPCGNSDMFFFPELRWEQDTRTRGCWGSGAVTAEDSDSVGDLRSVKCSDWEVPALCHG